jgi:hypothetical protein
MIETMDTLHRFVVDGLNYYLFIALNCDDVCDYDADTISELMDDYVEHTLEWSGGDIDYPKAFQLIATKGIRNQLNYDLVANSVNEKSVDKVIHDLFSEYDGEFEEFCDYY